jgi:xylose dehydrogenase (NAD/NADP)
VVSPGSVVASAASTAPVRWGILSTAWITSQVVPELVHSPLSTVVAVGSRTTEAASRFAEAYGLPRHYGSYERLLDDPDVEAVYIALPNSMHCEWTLAALSAGKNVLCEKPLTLDVEDAIRIFETADRLGLVIAEGFMYRHHPIMTELDGLLTAGAVGDVRYITSAFHVRAPDPETNIRYVRALGGGALADVGSYCVNFSDFIAKRDPKKVWGAALLTSGGVDAAFVGMLDYVEGVVAQFHCGIAESVYCAARVVGSDGFIEVTNPWLPDIEAPIWVGAPPRPTIRYGAGSAVTTVTVERVNPYLLEIENFCRVVRHQDHPTIAGDATVRSIRTLEYLRREQGLND